jgi:phosphoglycolate phosphatase
MRKYDLAIFDFDGTLADTFPWFSSVLNNAADRFGFNRVEPEDQEVLRSAEPQALLAYLGLPRWKLPFVAYHLRKRLTAQLSSISLFEGATSLLGSLASQGLTLALVTSNSEKNVRQMLGPDSTALFRYLVCGTSTFGKASKVRRIAAKCRVASARTLLIGDEIRDAEAARAAGVAFGAVAWGYNTGEALRARGPAEFFENISDILRILDDAGNVACANAEGA